MGCFGLSIPERYGGIQSDDHEDNMGMIVVTEELSRGSLGGAGSLITRPEILSRALLKGGTEEQRQKWLPQVAMGDPLCAIAVTEPDTGSDVAAMRLKASKCAGGWILPAAGFSTASRRGARWPARLASCSSWRAPIPIARSATRD